MEQLGGILQATLTLNGLIGGVTLGLFSLGILFKSANAKVNFKSLSIRTHKLIFYCCFQGALYGGIISLLLVVYIGIMALIRNNDVEPLSVSIESCNCIVSNSTITQKVNEAKNDEISSL